MAEGVTAYLTVGLPGSGKTTRAKEIEVSAPALRLSPDDWLVALWGNSRDNDHKRDPLEALQLDLAKRAVAVGTNVILDWGLWRTSERDYYRWHLERAGARTELVFCDASLDELKARIAKRNDEPDQLHIRPEEMDAWIHLFERPKPAELTDFNLDRDWYATTATPADGDVITQYPCDFRITTTLTPDDVEPHPGTTLRVGEAWVLKGNAEAIRVQG